jgi:outer membrane protein
MKKRYFLIAICCTICLAAAAQQRVIGIDEMFRLADENSAAIKASRTAMQEAEQAVKVSKNDYMPDIKLSASASYIGNVWVSDRDFKNGQTYESPHLGNNFAIDIKQVLYAGGAIANNVKMSELQAELAKFNLETQTQDVRNLLVSHYLDLYKCRNMLAVYDTNIGLTQQVIDDMRAKAEAGVALDNDIVRYELQKQSLIYLRTQLLGTIAILNNQLVVTLGLPAGTEILPDESLLAQEQQLASDEASWQQSAGDNSTALKSADVGVQMNERAEKLTKSGWIPKIGLVAANHLDGPFTYDMPPIDKNVNVWYVGIGLTYDIGSWYKTTRDVKRSQLAVQSARDQRAVAEEQIAIAVQAAYTRYVESFEQLKTQQKSVELATDNYNVIANRYDNGLVVVTDLIDASNAKMSAEIGLTNAQIDILANYYKLKYISNTL